MERVWRGTRGVDVLLQSGVRILQLILLGTCAYLVYAAISPAIGTGPSTPTRSPSLQEHQSGTPPWNHYQIISQRNLFQSAAAAPRVRTPAEEIEESKLRMKLHATISGNGNSIATVEDLSTRERFYVRPGDPIGTAVVEWIERRKVVIQNQGKREAITMDEETVSPAPHKRRAPRASSRNRPARSRAQRTRERLVNRLEQRSPARAQTPSRGASLTQQRSPTRGQTPSRAASLTQQATFRPALDEVGEIEGLLIENIQPGSALAESGLPHGSVCHSFNGLPLSDIESLAPASLSGQQNCLICRDPFGREQSYCF